MGWNTTILIRNDSMHEISKDPEFGRKVELAAGEWQRERQPMDIPGTNAMIVHQDHADNSHVLIVGGNYGSDVGSTFGYSHHKVEDQVRILKDVAKKLGYKLVKIHESGPLVP